jgi:glycine/D-amino acid oxidase-like deaminating enzyme
MPETGAESMGNTRVDVIVVGGGLAGTILGWTLRQRGLQTAVFDDPGRSTSSRIAAGLFNPVTGRRLTIAWRVRSLLETGRVLFREIERATGTEFYHSQPLVRFFTRPEMSDRWCKRREEAARSGLVFSEFDVSPDRRFRSIRGGFELCGSGYIDTDVLIRSVRESLARDGLWIQKSVGPDDVKVKGDVVTCCGISADHIVFAEGHLARFNPLLPPLPIKPDKGELLEVRIPDGPAERIYVGELFLVPRGQNRWIVGSTHDWNSDSDQPTDSGKNELAQKFAEMFDAPYEIVDHKAGIRPASADTRAFVGRHPNIHRAWIFNGFGSRSVLLAPYSARILAAAIIDGAPVEPELDVGRFWSRIEPSLPFRATRIAQECASEAINPGDVAVDATAGHGHDTKWLAERVGATGHVVAFDILGKAIQKTEKRLRKAGLFNRVTLKTTGHENLLDQLPPETIGRIAVIMFNLGYLAQGNRSIRTRSQTTLRALNDGLTCLRPGGRITIVLSPGDPVGQEEEEAVMKWMKEIPRDRVIITQKRAPRDPPHAPWVLVLTVPLTLVS